MKMLLTAALLMAALLFSCDKKCDDGCTPATITQSAPTCEGWGIVVNGVTYSSLNVPVNFREAGRVVCVEYRLYEDARKCACCGGTYADILSMK
ncbi:MAG TPA: hypothetical protein VFZ78_02045 [Flavisolibacter sp.]